MLRSSSGNQNNEFQFAGQQTDPTGLQYLRARYYDMETGRFISRDPLALSPDWTGNGFTYGDARPSTVVDPLGLDGDPFDDLGKLHPCNWGPVASRVCNRGSQIVDSIGDNGALQLVKLSGEYILRTGESFYSWFGENKDVVAFVVGEALAGAFSVCLSTGFGSVAGAYGVVGCSAVAAAYFSFSVWYINGADSDFERVLRSINMMPVMGRISVAKSIFDAISSALEPNPAR